MTTIDEIKNIIQREIDESINLYSEDINSTDIKYEIDEDSVEIDSFKYRNGMIDDVVLDTSNAEITYETGGVKICVMDIDELKRDVTTAIDSAINSVVADLNAHISYEMRAKNRLKEYLYGKGIIGVSPSGSMGFIDHEVVASEILEAIKDQSLL